MRRNFIGLVAGVVLHYILLIASSRLAWFLIVGNVDRNTAGYKSAVVNWMLWRTFAVDPAVAVVVAASVASVVRRSYWWVGGVATLPLLVYVSVHTADRIEIGSCVVYMMLAFGAALAVWRFKRPVAA